VASTVLAPWRADAALALHRLGERADARALIAEELAGAERWGDPWLLGQAHRVAAAITPDRDAHLARGLEVLRGSEARLELARTLLETGRARTGAAAREALAEALDLAQDAPAIAAEARAELVRAGARPRRAARTGRAALTATEERVARLAAAGPTNREIAQTLFVTEKTVEAHLSSAYRKLGVRSRGELVTALGAEGEL
jgi:DNA-binding CsgD family transcriptional regulator